IFSTPPPLVTGSPKPTPRYSRSFAHDGQFSVITTPFAWSIFGYQNHTYSKPKQVKALYDALLAPLAPEPMPKELEAELLAMRRLTPGDFHAVRSRMLFDGGAGVKHHVLLEGLRSEQELKLDTDRRGMGFLK
ncbi:MAG: hypothetical protein Q7J24_11635, partial [Desulfomicrobium sp.]|nr:hypothetical protein [Desulfomicrobium sp.]